MLLNVYDLVYLIIKYCDDESLNKLARVSRQFHDMLLKDETLRGK